MCLILTQELGLKSCTVMPVFSEFPNDALDFFGSYNPFLLLFSTIPWARFNVWLWVCICFHHLLMKHLWWKLDLISSYEYSRIWLSIIKLEFFSIPIWFYQKYLGHQTHWSVSSWVKGEITLEAWGLGWLATPAISVAHLPQHIPWVGQSVGWRLCGCVGVINTPL